MKRCRIKVWWTTKDILHQANALGFNWTLAEAETWLKDNEEFILFMMEDVGGFLIAELLNEDKAQP